MDNETNEAKKTTEANTVNSQISDDIANDKSIWKYIVDCNPEESQRQALALIDCAGEYTYGQMFAEWERYARVFSALDITEANHSRIGVAGVIASEPLFAFYAGNMTGATVSMMSCPDFLPGGHWKTMVAKEKITDLVISDILVMPDTWREIQKEKENLGLRNVILIHSRMGGPCTGPAEMLYNEFNYHALKRMSGTVFMDDLLKKYAYTQIKFGSNSGDQLAIITHTSGTTKGTRKPLPYTNRAVNTVATKYHDYFPPLVGVDNKQNRICPSFDFSSFLCANLSNSCFANGNTLVLTFFGFLHPKFIRAIDYYHLDVFFSAGFMMDKWLERTDIDDVDFSSLRVFACGGSYIPHDKLKKYKAFLKKHGYRYSIIRGYGMSEAGDAQLLVPDDCEDDILGYPSPKEDFIIQDEQDQKFYTVDDGVRTGLMFIASNSLCCNELDGEKLFDFTEINGRSFICTNDLVHINENGSFSYVGRADRYFVNNDGVRFESGVVETLMTSHPAVNQCAIVPVLDKRIHDTVPVLYVIPTECGAGATESIRKVIAEIFTTCEKLIDSCLPAQLIIVDNIPCNSNGKIDIFRITRERLQGNAYNIYPVNQDERLVDIRLEKAEQLNSITGGALPEKLEGNSSFGIYDIFNTVPSFPRLKFPFLKNKAKGRWKTH